MATRQRVLVFGGSDGIGAAIASRLIKDAGDVFITSRSLDKAQTAARAIGDAATGLFADVHQPESVVQAVDDASGEGALTGLAYCVGSVNLKPLARSTATDFADCYALNVIGAAMAIKAAAPALAASGHGSVVLFSTVAAQRGFANHAVIASAKAGIEGLTVSLAAELAPAIRINAIAPSLTDTPIAAPLMDSPTVSKSLAQQHPLKRLGAPEDHAALACLLLSPESSWMTGQIIGVDGGRGRLNSVRG